MHDDIYTPLCDRHGCHGEQAPDGLVEVVAFVGDQFATVRVTLCAAHRDLVRSVPAAGRHSALAA